MSKPRDTRIADHWPYVREIADRMSQQKRLTDSELAAEWHKQDSQCGQKFEGYAIAHNGEPLGTEEEEVEKLRTVHRFATLPHYDEDQP